MSNITLDIKTINAMIGSLYEAAYMNPPEIKNEKELHKVINTLKDHIKKLSDNSLVIPAKPGEKKGRVLVVDDLHLVTYQLKVLFMKLGFEVETSLDVEDALTKFFRV